MEMIEMEGLLATAPDKNIVALNRMSFGVNERQRTQVNKNGLSAYFSRS